MAHIGVLPSKTSLTVTSSNGDSGSIPAATPSTAGCMSAEQARMLAALWSVHQTGAGQTVLVEQALPSNMVTRDDLRLALSMLQRPAALPGPTIDITPIARELAELRQRVDVAPALQSATDPIVRDVLSQAIAQMADMDDRLRKVERVIATLQQVAEVRAAMEEAA